MNSWSHCALEWFCWTRTLTPRVQAKKVMCVVIQGILPQYG
jgi:hypothetical protein